MTNKYIINKGFSVKYDLQSLLLCYDYFNHGLILPKYIDYIFTRKIFHKMIRFLIRIAYFLRLYRFKYKISNLNENAIVIFKGKGAWGNKVELTKVNGMLKVVKKTFDNESYLREKKFYDKYKNSSLDIKLPKCKFLKENTIEMKFFKTKSFQRLINDGSLNLEDSIGHFNKIKEEVNLFYGDKISLIHSDFSPENIFIYKNKYYLIDFSDSQINDYNYDLYTLMRSILYSFNHKNVNNDLNLFSLKRKNLSKFLKISIKEIIKMEKIFQNLDIKKHPEHFFMHKKKKFPGMYYA